VHSATGFALTVRKGPLVIQNNIFMFMDNNALKIYADPKEVTLVGNVFNKNLYSNVLVREDKVIDDKTFAQLADVGFKASSGNTVENPDFDLDPSWMNVYMNRTAYVPGKVTMDDWNQMRSLLGQPLMASGGKAADGFAPAYDWKKAMKLFPRNARVTAGARMVKLDVKFSGVARTDATAGQSYQDVAWDALQSGSLVGQRIAVKIALENWNESCQFPPDIKREDYRAVNVYGPEGKKGLPIQAFVRKSTRLEKLIGDGPELREWKKPEALYLIKGLLAARNWLIIESIEKSEEE
jgi:hypothetical protein